MTRPKDIFEDDRALGEFLRRRHSMVVPDTDTLAALEQRIMAGATKRARDISVGQGWLPGVAEQPWVLRSAGLLAVLVLALGFAAGQGLNLSASGNDSADVFAASAGTPWQSFITTASLGDNDESGDETNDGGGDDNGE